MSQAFSLTPRGLKTVYVSNTVTVPMASTTQLLELNLLDGVEKVSFQVDNITQALDAFVVEGRVHQDASYFTIANAAGDFSAPSGRIFNVSGAPVSLAASASARFDLDVSGLYSVKVSASAAADSAVVTIYASGAAAGAANNNVTLTTGDLEIGAVEIKNATDDTRAVVGANGLYVDVRNIQAGTALIGKVGIDQTTPGTTNKVVASVASGGIASGAIASGAIASGAIASGAVASGAVASGAIAAGAVAAGALVDGADLTQGVTTGAAVITDANGTVQQYLRGLVKMWATGVALTPSANVITTQRPAVTQVVSTALEASKVLKASAGQLVQLTVFSSRTSSQYILIMNSTTVPGDGAVTLLYPPIPIGAASLLVIDFPAPLVASTGIAVSNSSTGTFTKTIGSADCVFHAQVN